jgi:hypothetical protein
MSTITLPESKPCTKCGIVKPYSEFSIERRKKDGHSARCRACTKALRPEECSPPESYVLPLEKKCTKCDVSKPLDEFSPYRLSWDKRQSQCRACVRDAQKRFAATPDGKKAVRRWEDRSRLKYRYGVSIEDYERRVSLQAGKCAICNRVPTSGRGKRLQIDHDHTTGRFRGLLCHKCNTALGTFGDDLEGVMKVVAYLRRQP